MRAERGSYGIQTRGGTHGPRLGGGWLPINAAPLDEDVPLQLTDGRGEPYRLLPRPAGSARARGHRWLLRR